MSLYALYIYTYIYICLLHTYIIYIYVYILTYTCMTGTSSPSALEVLVDYRCSGMAHRWDPPEIPTGFAAPPVASAILFVSRAGYFSGACPTQAPFKKPDLCHKHAYCIRLYSILLTAERCKSYLQFASASCFPQGVAQLLIQFWAHQWLVTFWLLLL